MRYETKQNTTEYTVLTTADQVIIVTGFSFTPTAVLVAYVTYGVADNTERYYTSFGGGQQMFGLVNTNELIINSITFDTVNDEVDLSIRNASANTLYIEQVIVTAVG